MGSQNALGQISTDGSVGPQRNLNGPNVTIPNSLGTQVGTNLFHSFRDFNINTGQSATFTTDFAGVTENVISRVTGGNPSSINGLLRSQIPGADFWFINPSGMTFGAGASLDVPASFHAATADYVLLANGTTIPATATPLPADTLIVADLAGFGFLDALPVGRLEVRQTSLSVPALETLSLVGQIGEADGQNGVVGGELLAPGGRVNLIGVASGGEVLIDADRLSEPVLQGFADLGSVGLTAGSAVSVAGATPGRIFLRGGSIILDGSYLRSDTDGLTDAGTISVNATGQISIADGGQISATTSGSGRGGDITVETADLSLMNGGRLDSSTSGAGDAGDVTIRGTDGSSAATSLTVTGVATDPDTGEITLDEAGQPVRSAILTRSTATGEAGQAGSIQIRATDVSITDGGEVNAETVDGEGPNGEAAEVTFGVDVLRVETGERSVSTATTGSGNAGHIAIHGISGEGSRAADLRLFSSVLDSSSASAGSDAGASGDIDVSADLLIVSGFDGLGGIFATTSGGPGGDVDIAVGKYYADYGGVATTATSGSGNAGNITVGADELVQFTIGGRILTQSTSTATDAGAAGDVTITAPRFILGAGDIIASTVNGAGGNITMYVDHLSVEQGGSGAPSHIESRTVGTGNAGDIAVRGIGWTEDNPIPATIVGVSGEGGDSLIRVNSTSDNHGAGDAGDIEITAKSVGLSGGGLDVTTVSGKGGDITLNVDHLTMGTGGAGSVSPTLRSGTFGVGDAGDITIRGSQSKADNPLPAKTVSITGNRLRPFGLGLLASSSGTGLNAGAAGNIDITTDKLTLGFDGTLSATTIDGRGGTITLNVGTLNVEDGGQITASTSGSGDAGDVIIRGTDASSAATSVTITGVATNPDSGEIMLDEAGQPVRSAIRSRSTGAGDAGKAGNIRITATAASVTDGGEINAETVDGEGRNGEGGSITLNLDDLVLSGGASVTATTTGRGNAGNIQVVADHASIREGGRISSSAVGTGADAGKAGNITVTAGDLTVREGGQIAATTVDGGQGSEVGNIAVAVGALLLSGGGQVTAATSGHGDAGDVEVTGLGGPGTAVSDMTITGSGRNVVSGRVIRSGITSASTRIGPDAGQAGKVAVAADDITLTERGEISTATVDGQVREGTFVTVGSLAMDRGARITSDTSGQGDAGLVRVDASDITLTGADTGISSGSTSFRADAGDGGSVLVSADTLAMRDGGQVNVATQGGGNAGDIEVTAQTVVARGAGSGLVSSSTAPGTGAGKAGNIAVIADAITVSNGALIAATTADGEGANGEAGSITLHVGRISITDGAQVNASTSGFGAGGDVTVRGGEGDGSSAESVLISGSGRIATDSTGTTLDSAGRIGIEARSEPGKAGNVTIASESLTVENGGEISARTADGEGGAVALTVKDVTLQGGTISAATTGAGHGGSVTLAGLRQLVIGVEGLLTAATSGSGDGGTISITIDGDLQIDGGAISSSADSVGAAGDIVIVAADDQITLDNGAKISVSSSAAGGRAGNINVSAADLLMHAGSVIEAEALQEGAYAGNVELLVTGTVHLVNSRISGQSAAADEAGGSFTVSKPKVLILEDHSSIVASSASGSGGVVTIEAEAIVFDSTSTVSGTGGVFTIGSVLANTLQNEAPETPDAASELETGCTPQQIENRSTLVVTNTPPGAVRSPYLTATGPESPMQESAALVATTSLRTSCAGASPAP